MTSAFDRIAGFVRDDLVSWYRTRGDLALGYAAGSLVEGFSEDADLDLTLVWRGGSPPACQGRWPAELADATPTPVVIEQPNFNLDRFWVSGQQLDVKHVTLTEFEAWATEVEAGRGFSGYPMAVIVLHAFTTGAVVFDSDGLAEKLRRRLLPPSKVYVNAAAARWTSSRSSYLDEMAKCVQRGDGLLFEHLAVEAVRCAFIAWFARGGQYWPHEKRLGERLRRFGKEELSELEARVWVTPGLHARYEALTALFTALDPA